ncbi:MAG: hypothetical protein ABL997_21655, partial [Planctomycetota bacterium]
PRKRSSFGAVMVLLATVVLLMVFLIPVSGGPRVVQSSVSLAPEAVASAMEDAANGLAEAARNIEWSRTARRDLELARTQLEEQVEQFRARAPIEIEQRMRKVDLPVFGPIRILDASAFEGLQQQLLQLEISPGYDEGLAEELRTHGVIALKLAAQVLQGRDLASAPLSQNVKNLQRFLQETTGAVEIRLLEDPTASPAARLRANDPVPSLWLWWIDTFARDDETFKAYQKLQAK